MYVARCLLSVWLEETQLKVIIASLDGYHVMLDLSDSGMSPVSARQARFFMGSRESNHGMLEYCLTVRVTRPTVEGVPCFARSRCFARK